jgi:predicted CDP-diglyceride synthetase/phosphatidate cytidylyltransferase
MELSNVEWCEAKTHRYQITINVSEFANSISNMSFIYVALISPYTNQKHIRCNFALFIVGLGSFYFHATESYYGEIMDEVPMSILAYNYFNCINNYKNSEQYNIIYKYVLIAFWAVYIATKTYDLFLILFAFQLALVLYTFVFKVNKTSYQKVNLAKAIIALAIAKGCWQYERHLYETDQCETDVRSYRYYLHSYWHIGSAASHYYIMTAIANNKL